MKKKKLKLTIFQKKNHKGSAVTDILPWLIAAVVLLVILMFTIFVLKGTGISFIDKIKNFFRGW